MRIGLSESGEKKEEYSRSRLQYITITIAVSSLLVTFTGVNYQAIQDFFTSLLFPRSDFVVRSMESPTIYGFNYQVLDTSPRHYIVTSLTMKSLTVYQGEPLQFSVSFENRGKTTLEKPRIAVYFIDFLHRVWSTWNSSMGDKFPQGCSIEFHFPSLDKRVTGTWIVLVLLYDDTENMLISYNAKTITVTDRAPAPWWREPTSYILVVAVGFIVSAIYSLVFSYFKERRKTRTLKRELDEHLRKPKEGEKPEEGE